MFYFEFWDMSLFSTCLFLFDLIFFDFGKEIK